ncbi:hypothetical protein Trydic_g15673 [Trypoxylus dichotomus]
MRRVEGRRKVGWLLQRLRQRHRQRPTLKFLTAGSNLNLSAFSSQRVTINAVHRMYEKHEGTNELFGLERKYRKQYKLLIRLKLCIVNISLRLLFLRIAIE